MNYKRLLMRNLSNIPGKSINRKIIVFESDDWGSVRMPSIESFKKLTKKGVNLSSADAERYNRNDNLASSNDLEALFEILSKYKDFKENNLVFTPISLVANPDFEKIKDSGFREYFFESFNNTLKRHIGCERSFDLWKEGIENNIFVPQMHGREHLNVLAWMNALRKGDTDTHLAFTEGMWGFVPKDYPKVDYQAAFLLSDILELDYHRKVISEGLQLFEKLFGYKAEYFVPPNGPFNNSLNSTLAEGGIKYRSVAKIQHETLGSGKSRKVLHYMGQKEKNGITYLTRNCFFEPSQGRKDWIDSCLNDINIAFKWNKPAVISTHRVNYIGSINPSNRDDGLRQLTKLMDSITKKWPYVEFMTTPKLGEIVKS